MSQQTNFSVLRTQPTQVLNSSLHYSKNLFIKKLQDRMYFPLHAFKCKIIIDFSIWERLLQMAANGNKTVIITTHYIEEARQAHTVS